MDGSIEIASPSPSSTPRQLLLASARPAFVVYIFRLGLLILFLAIGAGAANQGWHFRQWMWRTTEPIRFVPDIDRGYQWGRYCTVEGYLNQYEKMQPQQPADLDWLDYAPLRLAVMAFWGKWSLSHFPQVEIWHQNASWALTTPVLYFNLGMEIIGLVAAFFLTRLWAIRGGRYAGLDPSSVKYFFRGWIPASVAVLLLWFNPAIVISAYGWPTWDVWIVPMFLLAALLASLDWWFFAGAIIGIGAMFKGQQLLAVPIFAVWTLILLRPLFTLRFLSGVLIAIAVVASPWLLSYIPAEKLAVAREIQAGHGRAYKVPIGTFKIARTFDLPAALWVACVMLSAFAMPWVSWLSMISTSDSRWRKMFARNFTWRTIAALATFMMVAWPWCLTRNQNNWHIGLPAALLMVCTILLIRPRGMICLASASTGIALLLCMSIFHGSTAWYDCGIHFGTIHWPRLATGMTDNLPAILAKDFRWSMDDLSATAITIPAQFIWHPQTAVDLSSQFVLLSLFWLTFILSCIGLGLHARRKSPRVLIALVAPWLMFFCFPPQIHERYLLFAAAASCICAGVSTGMTLLGILLSLITFMMTLHTMLVSSVSRGSLRQLGQSLARQYPHLFSDASGYKLLNLLNGTYPDLGYAVVLCGLVFLYFSISMPFKRP